MAKQRFEVVHDTETGRVEVFEDGQAFMGAWVHTDMRQVLMDALANPTPAFVTGTLDAPLGLTTEATAALLEELLSRQYDQTKARVLTMIEAILGKSNLGTESEGRLLNYLMEPMKADLLRIVRERAPEVAAILDERRKNPAWQGGIIGTTAPVVNVTVNGADVAKEAVEGLMKSLRRGLGAGGERKPREIGTETYTMP